MRGPTRLTFSIRLPISYVRLIFIGRGQLTFWVSVSCSKECVRSLTRTVPRASFPNAYWLITVVETRPLTATWGPLACSGRCSGLTE